MASSSPNTGSLSEEELKNLASKVGPLDVNLVAYVLGMPRRNLENIRQECGQEAEETSCKILTWWKEHQNTETDLRRKLAGILNKIEREDLSRMITIG